ncbi:MAG: hypothetical protein HW421_924 [Ignavibacteria bacterium]|nr:hypothetical protein [Ignavibacteria bacterium]
MLQPSLAFCSDTTITKPVIVGSFTWEQWKEAALWKDYSASDYKIDSLSISNLKEKIKSKNPEFIMFSGSWCGDSESEVPKFYKLMMICSYSIEKIILIGLDRNKAESGGSHIQYNITNVPTLIVIVNGKEVGRITEFPTKSWEEDILKILSDK